MSAAQATGERLGRRLSSLGRRFAPEAPLLPGLVVVALMLVWAVHDGGYDEDTWYWGALVMLALFAAIVIGRGVRARAISRAGRIALAAFALYVAWSYLSIAWAQAPGVALSGSNRALLYLLVFATMLVLPWTPRAALAALLAFAIGVGVIGIVLLFRLASADQVDDLVIAGRLAAPTGYFNSTAALFMMESLVSIALATRRELPGPVRGLLIGFACAGLQLAVIVQSRGWLFTLPIMAILTLLVLPNRLRVVAAAVLPVAATLVPVHRLLAVFDNASGAALNHAASRAGSAALTTCAVAFFVATLVAWGEPFVRAPAPSAARRRALAAITTTLVLAAVCVGTLAATHGDPVGFVKRQWNGFSHQEGASPTGSHFANVGSGRYDFWRVGLDAFVAHPIGGLGQDNFADYYISRRRTAEEPAYTHSLEIRLLTHTGLVGFVLFAVFLAAAIAAALRARRRPGLEALVAGAALLPLIVWVIYGSVDWFWEFPALSAPALGFLAMACALGVRPGGSGGRRAGRVRRQRKATARPARDRRAAGPVAGAHDRRRSTRAGGGGGRARVPVSVRAGGFRGHGSRWDQSAPGAPRPPHGCRSQPAERRPRPLRWHVRAPGRGVRDGEGQFRAGGISRARELVCVARGGTGRIRARRSGAGPPRLPGGGQDQPVREDDPRGIGGRRQRPSAVPGQRAPNS